MSKRGHLETETTHDRKTASLTTGKDSYLKAFLPPGSILRSHSHQMEEWQEQNKLVFQKASPSLVWHTGSSRDSAGLSGDSNLLVQWSMNDHSNRIVRATGFPTQMRVLGRLHWEKKSVVNRRWWGRKGKRWEVGRAHCWLGGGTKVRSQWAGAAVSAEQYLLTKRGSIRPLIKTAECRDKHQQWVAAEHQSPRNTLSLPMFCALPFHISQSCCCLPGGGWRTLKETAAGQVFCHLIRNCKRDRHSPRSQPSRNKHSSLIPYLKKAGKSNGLPLWQAESVCTRTKPSHAQC